MPYLTPADLRDGTNLWPDIKLSPQEASDARLTTEIATQSAVIEQLTGDKFEQVTGATLTLPVTEYSSFIFTPGYRIRAVGSVSSVDNVGTSVLVDAEKYRFHSFGIERLDGYTWPYRSVTLTGVTYGWVATPGDVKRAVAVLVYDALKSSNASRLRATRWTAGDTTFERSVDGATGIPEVDIVVDRYRLTSRIGAG